MAMKSLSAQVRSVLKKRKKEEAQLKLNLAALKKLSSPSEIDINNAEEKLSRHLKEKPSDCVGLFRQLDTDGNKTLDPVEWLDGLRRLEVSLSPEEIKVTFSLFDTVIIVCSFSVLTILHFV